MHFIKYITDLNAQLNNAPLYKSYNFSLNGEDIWIQYFKGDLCTYTYDINGAVDICGVPSILIIKKFDDNLYAIYRYLGNVKVSRKIENNIVFDTINNLLEIEKNIV